jgi:CHAT domain-containing protein
LSQTDGFVARGLRVGAAATGPRTYTDEAGNHLYEHPYYWSPFVLIGTRS